MEYLSGVVERITFANEENGFTVAKLKSKGFPELVTIVGNMAAVNIGAVVRLKGQWKLDSKFGRQFSVTEYEETLPATILGIEKYLGSGLIKGIGPVNAKRIVKHFGLDTIMVIEEEPQRLVEVEGIGAKRVAMIQVAWGEQKEIKNIMLFLQSHGVSTSFAVKIYKTYQAESIKVVKENPYRLADDIWGIGFKTADTIASKMGFDPLSYERCRSGLMYVLNEFANEGHCFARQGDLVEKAEKMLEIPAETIQQTLSQMVEEKSVIVDDGDGVYLPPFYYSEVGVANKINQLVSLPGKLNATKVDELVAQIEQQAGINYDQVQKDAIAQAAQSKFMVLTGGPGTGKTTTTNAIIKVFESMGANIMLAAPTGRAAKRMTETTGLEAKTIHRLLEFKPGDGYKKNEENLLACDVLIIDESSMMDIILFYNLLKAVPLEAIVLLVGDIDQLPSVSAGNVLHDIIASQAVPVVRLQRIFRQAQGSMIITNAHRINQGQMPMLKGGKDADFFFMEEESPDKIVERIKELCAQRLPAYYQVNPKVDIQVLCPMQRGETGAFNLNQVLQETLNPQSKYIKYGGVQYRLNDKVMQIKNNYDKNVFNGDIGIITELDQEDKTLVLTFDGNPVEYDATELDEVMLAYATTIHKSQGSEYPIVVAPFSIQHYMMLQRNLLYTCVTRAKRIMVLVGSKKAVAMSVNNHKITSRNTMLAARLQPSGAS